MKKGFFCVAVLLVFASCVINAQENITENNKAKVEQRGKAKQILESALRAMKRKTDGEQIKTILITYEETQDREAGEIKFRSFSSHRLSFALPDKIHDRISTLISLLGRNSNSRQEEIYILNGDKISHDLKVFNQEGDLQNTKFAKNKNSLISFLKRRTFLLCLPLLFDVSWYVPLEFSYVGLAESKDGNANVIEAITPGKITYRLFFDIKTHLLLLMTENWQGKEGGQFENKFFFSDYKEVSGFLMPTRIVHEMNGKVMAEKVLIDIKINPDFKSDMFLVREEN